MSGSAAIDLEDFGDQGIAFPIEVYAADEARGLKARYDAFQTEAVARRGHETFIKPHLISTWLDGVVRHPAILDADAGAARCSLERINRSLVSLR